MSADVTNKVSRPALVFLAISLAAGQAGAQLALTQTSPLGSLDRFTGLLSPDKARDCFSQARSSPNQEAAIDNGLYTCSISLNFSKIQLWTDKTAHDANPGQPDFTLIADAPHGKPNGKFIVLIAKGGADATARMPQPEAETLQPVAAKTSSARLESVSVLTQSELLTLAPRLEKTVSAMNAIR